MKNPEFFKRRIMGLVSYFPDIDELLPKYDKNVNFKIQYIDMSMEQFSIYEKARVQERKIELNNARKRGAANKKGDVYEEAVSTYRIFSRAFCNFVFPKDIIRPLPGNIKNLSERIAIEELENASKIEDSLEIVDNTEQSKDDDHESPVDESYAEKIVAALKKLKDNKELYLTPDGELKNLSPKFLNILLNINDPKHYGLHLVYSQFRILEGIGILALVLEANGYAQFKIRKVKNEWRLDISEKDITKPKFVLYTGTENAKEKEIVRNIFNSNWDKIPENLKKDIEDLERKIEESKKSEDLEESEKSEKSEDLEKSEKSEKSEKNLYGNIIKVFMITASGAEGISLNNVRYVHITEPYWHPVRIDQVIGRARRICSHSKLEPQYSTVDVFLYLMKFTKAQLDDEKSIELKTKDLSKLEKGRVYTSDQTLYEISQIKESCNKSILHNIKEASIDCNIHKKIGNKENLQCLTFHSITKDDFSYIPSYIDQNKNLDLDENKTKQKLKLKTVGNPPKYAVNMANTTNEKELYSLESAKSSNPIQIGILHFKDSKVERIELFGEKK